MDGWMNRDRGMDGWRQTDDGWIDKNNNIYNKHGHI